MPEKEDTGRNYLSLGQAAAFLKRGTTTLCKWRADGILPKQQAWTREELRAAEARAAALPPRPRTGGRQRRGDPPAAPQVLPESPKGPENPPAPAAPAAPTPPAMPQTPASLDLNLPKAIPPAAAANAPPKRSRGRSSLDLHLFPGED